MAEITDKHASTGGGSVQSSYDECDGVPSFVVADVTTDDAWLAVPAGTEVSVATRR